MTTTTGHVMTAASVALIAGAKVLLIRRARPPWRGLWTLPGGGCEPGETPAACAVRELREEIGLSARALRRVLVQRLTAGTGRWRLTVFATTAFEGELVADPDEIAGWAWVGRDGLSALRTTAGLSDVLDRAFALFPRS